MRRRNPDDRLRSQIAEFRATGDLDLAERVARELIRRGVLPSTADKPYYLQSRSTANVLPSFTAILPPDGPALCLVPINDQILHVRIAPLPGDTAESREARVSHYHAQHDPWPGLPVKKSAYGSASQGYSAAYTPCVGEFPPYYHQTSATAKRWDAWGEAVVHVDPDTAESKILRLSIGFHGGRTPPRMQLRQAQLRGELRPRLQAFLSQWVPEHLDAFQHAEFEVDATEVANALQAVDFAHQRVQNELEHLDQQRVKLSEALGRVLDQI